jgi:uncharacterized membrane protein
MRQSRLASSLFGVFFFVPAFMISPASVNHPLWIVAIYLCVTTAFRVVTHDFGGTKNPTWGMHFVFVILRFLTGTFIVSSIITRGLSPLWLVVAVIFFYFGRESFQEITYIFARKSREKRLAKRAGLEPEDSAKSEAERRWNRDEFHLLIS